MRLSPHPPFWLACAGRPERPTTTAPGKNRSPRSDQLAACSARKVLAVGLAEGNCPDLSATPTAESPQPLPLPAAVAVPALLAILLTLFPAAPSRAEYIVLRSGQRLAVTGYQLNGDTYHLQLQGGTADLPASEVAGIEPEEVFYPIPRVEVSKSPFREQIQAAAARYGVDPDLISSVIAAESNFDPRAVSRRNARGLMQLLPQTAARLGVKNVFDPTENIDAGTHYLSELLRRYNNNLVLTLAAYNAGPQSVQRYGRVPPFRETQTYVQRVGKSYAQRKSSSQQRASGNSQGNSAGKTTIAATISQPVRSPQP